MGPRLEQQPGAALDQLAVPTITWNAPTSIHYGVALSDTQLNAHANVPGSFSYTPPAGTVLSAGAGQVLSAHFTRADTLHYTAADATVLIDVSQSDQTILFGALVDKIVGDPPFSVSATASSGLPVDFSSVTPTVCTLSGTVVTVHLAGTCAIVAQQAGDANVRAAAPVTRSFAVTASGIRRRYLALIKR